MSDIGVEMDRKVYSKAFILIFSLLFPILPLFGQNAFEMERRRVEAQILENQHQIVQLQLQMVDYYCLKRDWCVKRTEEILLEKDLTKRVKVLDIFLDQLKEEDVTKKYYEMLQREIGEQRKKIEQLEKKEAKEKRNREMLRMVLRMYFLGC
jgi:predicted ATP-binding protein involved in virulence